MRTSGDLKVKRPKVTIGETRVDGGRVEIDGTALFHVCAKAQLVRYGFVKRKNHGPGSSKADGTALEVRFSGVPDMQSAMAQASLRFAELIEMLNGPDDCPIPHVSDSDGLSRAERRNADTEADSAVGSVPRAA